MRAIRGLKPIVGEPTIRGLKPTAKFIRRYATGTNWGGDPKFIRRYATRDRWGVLAIRGLKPVLNSTVADATREDFNPAVS